MLDVYLVRHGQTAWNKDKMFRGRHDVPLNEQGRREAACARDALKAIAPAAIYTSPLSRAQETAIILNEPHKMNIHLESPFVDIDYGEWTGIKDVAVQKGFPEMHRLWTQEPEWVRFPRGETLSEVSNRAWTRFSELCGACDHSPLIVVSHRVVLKLLLAKLKNLSEANFWEIQVDTASITHVKVYNDIWSIVAENRVGHLAGLDARETTDF